MIMQQPHVAVILPTYNGARFVEEQIRSLAENATPFTLHWLDDHSTDNTREIVRSTALSAGIELREWHQPQHLGFPGTFFRLLDCVDADVYLSCDQDDIWQRGKIDAAVANLLPAANTPLFCFSEPLVFYQDQPDVFYRQSEILGTRFPAALDKSRAFLSMPAPGQSVGITRALREMYLGHKDIAQTYAFGLIWWLYLLAVATGEVRMLTDVPRTLWRQHGGNFSSAATSRNRKIISRIVSKWRWQNSLRRGLSRQAQGFILASATLPPGPKLERLLALAPLVATIDQRQSPAQLIRLLFRRAMRPGWALRFLFATTCLWSSAAPPPSAQRNEGTITLSRA